MARGPGWLRQARERYSVMELGNRSFGRGVRRDGGRRKRDGRDVMFERDWMGLL